MNIEAHAAQESIAPEDAVDVHPVVTQLIEIVEDQQEMIAELQADIKQLREDQEEDRDHAAKDRAEIRQQVSDVKDRVEDVEQLDDTQGSTGEDTDADAHMTPQTPLEQTARLPQEMLDRESANVRRAVFLARDAKDYTTKVPAGRAIRSSELRRVLKAGTDCRGHSQTVDRVISLLDDLGGDDAQVVERHGERRVVFTEEIVTRLEQLTAEDQPSHDVVSQGVT